MSGEGGHEAMQLRVAEEYIQQFGNLAKTANTLVVPANVSDIAGMIAMATKVFEQRARTRRARRAQAARAPPPRPEHGAAVRSAPAGAPPALPR